MVVAFQEVESPQARMLRHFATGAPTEDDLRGKPIRRDHYWCAADEPPQDDSFRVMPVYRTNEVPEGACCEDCGVSIRDLQESLTRATHPHPETEGQGNG